MGLKVNIKVFIRLAVSQSEGWASLFGVFNLLTSPYPRDPPPSSLPSQFLFFDVNIFPAANKIPKRKIYKS